MTFIKKIIAWFLGLFKSSDNASDFVETKTHQESAPEKKPFTTEDLLSELRTVAKIPPPYEKDREALIQELKNLRKGI